MIHTLRTIISLHPDFVGMSEAQHKMRAECHIRRVDRSQRTVLMVTGRARRTADPSVDKYRAMYRAAIGAFPDLILTGEIRAEDMSGWD